MFSEGATMASEIGQIPIDGGEFLKFLIAVREIAERFDQAEARLAQIEYECTKGSWSGFIDRLGGPSAVAMRFAGEVSTV